MEIIVPFLSAGFLVVMGIALGELARDKDIVHPLLPLRWSDFDKLHS